MDEQLKPSTRTLKRIAAGTYTLEIRFQDQARDMILWELAQLLAARSWPGVESLDHILAPGAQSGALRIDLPLRHLMGPILWCRAADGFCVRIARFRADNRPRLLKGLSQGGEIVLWLPKGPGIVRARARQSLYGHEGYLMERMSETLVTRGVQVLDQGNRTAAPQWKLEVELEGRWCSTWLHVDRPLRAYQRYYRPEPGPAPMRPSLAALALFCSEWASDPGPLEIPMAGSGTLAWEALGHRLGYSPRRWSDINLSRSPMGHFLEASANWEEAHGPWTRPPIGETWLSMVDQDPKALETQRVNGALGPWSPVEWQTQLGDWFKAPLPKPGSRGTVILNPPYDLRLPSDTEALYGTIAQRLESYGQLGWRWAVVVPNQSLHRFFTPQNPRWYHWFHGGLSLAFAVYGGQPQS